MRPPRLRDALSPVSNEVPVTFPPRLGSYTHVCLQNKGGEQGGKRSGEAARASHCRGARKGAGAAGPEALEALLRPPRPRNRAPAPGPPDLPSARVFFGGGTPRPYSDEPIQLKREGRRRDGGRLLWTPFAPQTLTHFGKRPPRSRKREPGGRPRGGGARGEEEAAANANRSRPAARRSG